MKVRGWDALLFWARGDPVQHPWGSGLQELEEAAGLGDIREDGDPDRKEIRLWPAGAAEGNEGYGLCTG